MAAFILSLIIILVSLIGLGIGALCGRPHLRGGCGGAVGTQGKACACLAKPGRRSPS
jgi:hypothetical protein